MIKGLIESIERDNNETGSNETYYLLSTLYSNNPYLT